MSIGNDDLGYIFTFLPVLNRRSAVFLFTDETGLPVYTVALKKELFTLKVTWRVLIFPEGHFITYIFLIEINFGAEIMCFAIGETFEIGSW